MTEERKGGYWAAKGRDRERKNSGQRGHTVMMIAGFQKCINILIFSVYHCFPL